MRSEEQETEKDRRLDEEIDDADEVLVGRLEESREEGANPLEVETNAHPRAV